MTNKNYDKQVKDWWTNKFTNSTKAATLNSFFETLKEGKVQMLYMDFLNQYTILQVIEGDTLLVKTVNGSYCIIYLSHETFIRLIFPFDEDYNINLVEEED